MTRVRFAPTPTGNLFVSGHRSGHFTKTDARRLETLAAYAGVAIANAEPNRIVTVAPVVLCSVVVR